MSKNLHGIYEDESWMRPDRKISLMYKSRKINSLAQHFGQFAEDATAVLNCFRNNNTAEGEALSAAINRRRDVEALVNIDMPIGELVKTLTNLSDELHSEFHEIGRAHV